MTVKEVSRLCGVSVRTLHYYDEIGLLRPERLSGAGYRVYGEGELLLLQQILFFRELGFSLKEIRAIMQNPSFDAKEALEKQRTLLEMKRERISGLIRLVDQTLKGEQLMSFKEFDQSKIERARAQYAVEAKERWGNTPAYAQSEQKTKGYTKEDWNRIQDEAAELFKDLAAHMEQGPSAPETQALIGQWQAHITRYYYDCTDAILAGLGHMYREDRRFAENIDQYGCGLADFMSEAIALHTKNKM